MERYEQKHCDIGKATMTLLRGEDIAAGIMILPFCHSPSVIKPSQAMGAAVGEPYGRSIMKTSYGDVSHHPTVVSVGST